MARGPQEESSGSSGTTTGLEQASPRGSPISFVMPPSRPELIPASGYYKKGVLSRPNLNSFITIPSPLKAAQPKLPESFLFFSSLFSCCLCHQTFSLSLPLYLLYIESFFIRNLCLTVVHNDSDKHGPYFQHHCETFSLCP